jgi:hypothetical protein
MAELDALPERVDVLERKLDALSVSVDRRFEEVNQRFDEVNQRFDEVREQFVEQRAYTEFAFDRLERGLARLDRKLDQFIDGGPAPSPRRQPKKSRRPRDND